MAEWKELHGNWVLMPRRPVGIVHFLGGAFVATAPHITYRWLLESLGKQGYGVVATPFVNTFDHQAIAQQVIRNFNRAFYQLQETDFHRQYLPVYGLGHSMGCKLHLLIGSLYPVERAGNVFMAFNNYPAKRSIPFLEQFQQFTPSFSVEFTPSPAETNDLIARDYQIRRNLLIQFTNDDIDQTKTLDIVLQKRFPRLTVLRTLKGNHLTPLGQDIAWQVGESFSPIDAIAQFVKQEVYRDLNPLRDEILRWLNPLAPLRP